ncbi:hypothetical protein R6Q59_019493 [Mikania micrantha]
MPAQTQGEAVHMATTSERWIDGLQFSSLFWPPPQDLEQRKVLFTHFINMCITINLQGSGVVVKVEERQPRSLKFNSHLEQLSLEATDPVACYDALPVPL